MLIFSREKTLKNSKIGMPNCVHFLTLYQGEFCTHCTKGHTDISTGFSSVVGKVSNMAEGGAVLFPTGLQIPERETLEYITFLNDKLSENEQLRNIWKKVTAGHCGLKVANPEIGLVDLLLPRFANHALANT